MFHSKLLAGALVGMMGLAVFISGAVIGAGSVLLHLRQRALWRIHDLREAVACVRPC